MSMKTTHCSCRPMSASKSGSAFLLALVGLASATLPALAADEPKTMSEILKDAKDEDWRPVAAENLLIMMVGASEVVIELAPEFAPDHIENLRMLVAADYFDGLAVIRSQDNYVAQWGDPAGSPIAPYDEPREIGDAKPTIKGEFERRKRGVKLIELESVDAYADVVGFVDGFPVAGEGRNIWLTHCYGMVGVGRGNETNSGNSTSLYVVTGHAPRHLDRNVTLIGRVLSGIEALSSLRRGSGPLGFYATADQTTPIKSAVMASELPEEERPMWQRLRTETKTFTALIESRRTRHEEWFRNEVGRIGLCNVPLPARPAPPPPPPEPEEG